MTQLISDLRFYAMLSSRASVAGTVRSAGTSREDVRSDALRTSAMARDKNVNGVGVAAYLHPVNGYRGELERKGIKPTDHARKNVVAMRELQKQVQERKDAEEDAAAREKFKLKKFSGVESRVMAAVAVRIPSSLWLLMKAWDVRYVVRGWCGCRRRPKLGPPRDERF